MIRTAINPPRTRRCKICRTAFLPRSITHKACGPDCAATIAVTERERAERKAHKAAIFKAQPLPKFLKAAEKSLNAYVRQRDRYHGCISCEKPAHWDGLWTASHYKSVGSNSALRYNLFNINKGCSECNLFLSGNIGEYRRRLVLKLGAERVEWLDRQNITRRYDRDYLIRMAKIFNKKTRRLKVRQDKQFFIEAIAP